MTEATSLALVHDTSLVSDDVLDDILRLTRQGSALLRLVIDLAAEVDIVRDRFELEALTAIGADHDGEAFAAAMDDSGLMNLLRLVAAIQTECADITQSEPLDRGQVAEVERRNDIPGTWRSPWASA